MPHPCEILFATHTGTRRVPLRARAGVLGAIVCALVLAGCGESIPVDSHNRSPSDDDSHVVENEPLEAPAAGAGDAEAARQDGRAPQAREADPSRPPGSSNDPSDRP